MDNQDYFPRGRTSSDLVEPVPPRDPFRIPLGEAVVLMDARDPDDLDTLLKAVYSEK